MWTLSNQQVINTQHLTDKTTCSVTVGLCAASACSLQRAGDVSLTGGSAGCVATVRYWEETDQYTTRAAPSLSPHCTCSSTNSCSPSTYKYLFCLLYYCSHCHDDWMINTENVFIILCSPLFLNPCKAPFSDCFFKIYCKSRQRFKILFSFVQTLENQKCNLKQM